MKEYISRIKNGCKKHTFILWWVLRAVILYAFIGSFFGEAYTLTHKIHIFVCFVGTFLWELSAAAPEKSLFRHIPPSIHTAINAGFAFSSFCGVYLNLYYDWRWFDPITVAYFGFISVLYGYEVGYATVKRDKVEATKAMVFYVAFGVSFMLFNSWELGEFFSDQIIGLATGEAGNAQFWSVLSAEGTDRAQTVISSLVPERVPLMDIVTDAVFHTAGAFVALIFINICPYRLRGRYRYADINFGNNSVEVEEKEFEELKVSQK